jgi:hypothetical protein
MKMTHHHATFQVLPDSGKHSRIIWIADVWPNEAAERVAAMMEQGSRVMERTLNSAKSEV